MFALEIMIQNIDPEYDVIVPLVCACRRFAEVADSLPRTERNTTGGALIRGIRHGIFAKSSYHDIVGDEYQFEKVMFGKVISSVLWNDYPILTTNLKLGYRGSCVGIYEICKYVRVFGHEDGPAGYFERIEDVLERPAEFCRLAGEITRYVLGMEPIDFLRLADLPLFCGVRFLASPCAKKSANPPVSRRGKLGFR